MTKYFLSGILTRINCLVASLSSVDTESDKKLLTEYPCSREFTTDCCHVQAVFQAAPSRTGHPPMRFNADRTGVTPRISICSVLTQASYNLLAFWNGAISFTSMDSEMIALNCSLSSSSMTLKEVTDVLSSSITVS